MNINTQQKNVKWAEAERVDANDLTAMSDLKDLDIKDLLKIFFEPSTQGRVLAGFGCMSLGLLAIVGDYVVGNVAVSSFGDLLELPNMSNLSAALAPNATNYVYAYLLEQDSDSSDRRFINSVPVPPEEYTSNVATRVTKTVALYVFSNSDSVPSVASLQSTAVLSGKSRSLVALCAIKTNGVGATSTVDLRQMWMVNGNQVPSVNGGVDELPFTVGASNGPRNVLGVRSMFAAVASSIRELGSQTGRNWWDSTPTRTDMLNTVTKSTLQQRLMAVRSTYATVHPATGIADFTTLADALSGTSTGEIRLKAGEHLLAPGLALTGKTDLTLSGEGRTVTKLRFNDPTYMATQGFVLGAGTKRITFKDLTLWSSIDNPLGAGVLLDFTHASVEDITFENVHFENGYFAFFRTVAAGAKNVRFVNCTFNLYSSGVFDNSGAGWNPLTPTVFTGCYFAPLDTNACIAQTDFTPVSSIRKLTFNNCQFGSPDLTFTWRGWGSLTYAGPNEAQFNNCDFWGLESFVSAETQALSFDVKFAFNRCRVSPATVLPTSPFIASGSGDTVTFSSSARVSFYGCEILHSSIIQSPHPFCTWPNFTAHSTRFISSDAAASGVASSLFYSSGNGALYLTHRFTNCQFFHGTTCAVYSDCTSSGGSQTNSFFFNGCEFYTARVPNGQLLSANLDSVYIQQTGAGSHVLVVVIQACLFENNHATALPINLNIVGGSAKASCSLAYTWQNGTNGSVTDSGAAHVGWRASDVPTRLLSATSPFPV